LNTVVLLLLLRAIMIYIDYNPNKQLTRSNLPSIDILGSPTTALPFQKQIEVILEWAKERRSRVVCVANTHMLVEASNNDDFKRVLFDADLVTPDGMPLVWMMKLLGAYNQDRVAGMDIFEEVCRLASERGVSIYLVGSHTAILNRMQSRLEREFPLLKIAGMESPPFSPSVPEDPELVERINLSGAGVVAVSLGCPKQEYWMNLHRNRVHAVMIGLGAVFPVYAGIQTRAPRIIRDLGLEWLFRLLQEPQRLWKRYVTTIPVFIVLSAKQLVQSALVSMLSVIGSNRT
jgi:N-acetylglucosaminyldiphosphoundecaprenol N-acetyl-beta-D-mannosaminyltransferase